MGCRKCDLLGELYERTPQTERDYEVMMEIFMLLHDNESTCNVEYSCFICGQELEEGKNLHKLAYEDNIDGETRTYYYCDDCWTEVMNESSKKFIPSCKT